MDIQDASYWLTLVGSFFMHQEKSFDPITIGIIDQILNTPNIRTGNFVISQRIERLILVLSEILRAMAL